VKYLLLTVISLAIAVTLGQLIADDPGFVVIGYGGKVFRTSFVFFAVLLMVGIFALTFAWRALVQVFTLRTRWLGWTGEYRRKRSQRALSNGLLALAEGDFGRAEQLLSRGAEAESVPALHYLGAAQAAQAQNAAERRDNYLSLAREALPSAEVAIGIQSAEMQLETGQYEQARATLDYLADRHPDNKQVLTLQHRTYTEIGDTPALVALLPALRRHRVFPPEQLQGLELDAATAALSQPCSSVDDVNRIWNGLPKGVREAAQPIALYAHQLTALGFHEEAEKLLRKSLVRHWDDRLVRHYGEVRINNADLQLERAEGWLATREDDPELLMCLAKLAITADEWDKARSYLLRVLNLAPSPLAYQKLADVHEHADDHEAARRCHREGLRLATNSVGGLPAVVSVPLSI
jgi:HemY protein